MDLLATPARFHAATPAEDKAAPALPSLLLPADRAARQLRRQLPPPRPGLHASVIIPAKNEAVRLPATLAALAAQTDGRGRPLPSDAFEIVVLANNCADETARVVRAFAHRHPRLAVHVAEVQLPPAEAHVGRARRLLLDEAAHRLEQTAGPAGLLASTDADTCPAPTWLWENWREVQRGAQAVGGRILTCPDAGGRANGPAVRRTQLRDAAYRLLCAQLEARLDPDPADPWPRHHQHFGASLALTVRTYRQVGGLPVQPFLEDEALWQALRRHDLRLRHSPRVQVFTSDRQCGRVEVGLSWQLREWAQLSQQHQEPHVGCPLELARVWRARRQLRAWWQAGAGPASAELHRLARAVEVPLPNLLREARKAPTFGQFWAWVEHTRGAVLPVPLSQALRDVRRLLAELRH